MGRFAAVVAALSAAGVAGAAFAGSGHAPDLCASYDLRVSHPYWVSPITGVDMSGVRVTNVGTRTCALRGIPSATARAPGLPAVDAVPGAWGLTPPFGTNVTLAPRKAAAVVFATSHNCWPAPRPRYADVTLTSEGTVLTFHLPRPLRWAIDPACPPGVFGFFASR